MRRRALVGFGLYGVITNPQPLRKILAFNLIGNGVFLLFGAIARRGRGGGLRRRPGAAGAAHHRHRRCVFRDRPGRCAAAAAIRGNRLGYARLAIAPTKVETGARDALMPHSKCRFRT